MKLLETFDLGLKYDRPLHLENRMAMAPMTRSRADAEGNVGAMHETYYSQRATAGLRGGEHLSAGHRQPAHTRPLRALPRRGLEQGDPGRP